MKVNVRFSNVRTFKTSAFSGDARHESFMKAQNRIADCFIRLIVPDSLHQWFLDPLCFVVLVSPYYNLLKIIYCYSVLHIKKILCHNNVPTNVVLAALVTLINQLLVKLRNSFFEFAFASFWLK